MENNQRRNLLLKKFKIAYSRINEDWVKIVKVREKDLSKELIIDATLFSEPGKILSFKESELIDYS